MLEVGSSSAFESGIFIRSMSPDFASAILNSEECSISLRFCLPSSSSWTADLMSSTSSSSGFSHDVFSASSFGLLHDVSSASFSDLPLGVFSTSSSGLSRYESAGLKQL